MSYFTRFKNRIIAKLTSRFVHLSERLTDGFKTKKTEGVPWTPVSKPLVDCKVAIVTTAGVHHRNQKPFDMNDPKGDPSFRVIDSRRPISDLMITHDCNEGAPGSAGTHSLPSLSAIIKQPNGA